MADREAMRKAIEARPDFAGWVASRPLEVLQIKGKQNLVPKADYLPFVQDFLTQPYHGGKWAEDIGDLEHLGLDPEVLQKIPIDYAQGGLVGKHDFNGVVGYILE